MPEHKQQHYVPRCYFKPFSLEAEGLAVNLYNITKDRIVQNAPIKGQCAKSYLYGEDLVLEKLLQEIEGNYARIVSLIQNKPETLSNSDLSSLRDFAHLQYSRTDMAIRRSRIMHQGMHNMIYKGRNISPEPIDISDYAMMLSSMKLYVDTRKHIEDLKVCIVWNKTDSDFIISDDPSVFTSRFYVQKIKSNNFGLGSSGALFFLPLTPKHLLLCYDGGVYTIPDKQGIFLPVLKAHDVLVLNELQYLNAVENIYFPKWEDGQKIKEGLISTRPNRLNATCKFSAFVCTNVTEHGERYRLATEEERTTSNNLLLMMSSLHPAPQRWFSKLKYRTPVQAYTNGSSVGYVRSATIRLRS